jgi:hypothetical protein
MENRTLVIRVPLNAEDSDDIIGDIDTNEVILSELIKERYEDVFLTVETGDRVSS